jgi:hypothetical protein
MRIDFLNKVARYVGSINSNVLYMEQNVYVNLSKMQDVKQKPLISEQQFNFDLTESDFKVKLNFPASKDRFGRYA